MGFHWAIILAVWYAVTYASYFPNKTDHIMNNDTIPLKIVTRFNLHRLIGKYCIHKDNIPVGLLHFNCCHATSS